MPSVIELTPMRPNSGIQIEYTNSIKSIVRDMILETARYSAKLFENGTFDETPMQIRTHLAKLKQKYRKELNEKGRVQTIRMLLGLLKYNDASFRASIKNMSEEKKNDKDLKPLFLALIAAASVPNFSAVKNISDLPEKIKEPVMASYVQASEYLKSVVDEYILKITGSIMRSLQANDAENLKEEIKKEGLSALSRARLITEDQCNKANSAIALSTMERAGIRKFRWVYTYRSKEPRPYHEHGLNGRIFDLDNPPIIDQRTRERGFPAQLPNCKCAMQPVIISE